jgi:hexosaminidase
VQPQAPAQPAPKKGKQTTQPLSHSDTQSLLRYTLDGTEPTAESPLYTGPITLSTTTVVKARVYSGDGTPSFTATRKFNYDYIVSTSFSRKPNTPFNVGTDTLLFDGEKGYVEDLQEGWLGFSGDGVVTTVELSKPIDVESVTLRYAHAPSNWAFAPRKVTVYLSSDGEHYSDTLQVDIPFDPASEEEKNPRVVELNVPVGRQAVAFLKVDAQAIASVPAWHRAKGLKPWLLMDEIEVSEQLRVEK